MNKKFSGLVAVVALVLVALPLIASCAPAKEAPPAAPAAEVKPDAVWMRGSVAMTGPYAASLLPALEAAKDAINIVNTERDGIDGVEWKVDILDDGGDVAKAIANYEQLRVKEPKCLLFLNISTSDVAIALKDRWNEDGVVCWLPSCAPAAIYPSGNTFSIITPYADGFGLFCDWLVETQPKPIKLGFCTWDSSMGKSVLTDECLNYAKQKGIEIVEPPQLYGIMEMDVSTQLTNLKNAGANWVYTNTLGFGTVVLLKTAASLGLKDEMHFAGCHFAMDNDVNYVAGPAGEGFVGYHNLVTWYETDNPYVAERIAAFKAKDLPIEQKAQPYLVFKGWFELEEMIYENAIAEVGWENLDADALKNQIYKLKDYDAEVGIFTYSPDKPEPRHARIVQFKGGKILPITDWRVCPDLRPAEYK